MFQYCCCSPALCREGRAGPCCCPCVTAAAPPSTVPGRGGLASAAAPVSLLLPSTVPGGKGCSWRLNSLPELQVFSSLLNWMELLLPQTKECGSAPRFSPRPKTLTVPNSSHDVVHTPGEFDRQSRASHRIQRRRMCHGDMSRCRNGRAGRPLMRLKVSAMIGLILFVLVIPQKAWADSLKDYKAVFETTCKETVTLKQTLPPHQDFLVCVYLNLASAVVPWTAFTYKVTPPDSPSAEGYELGLAGDSGSLIVWMFGNQILVPTTLNLATWYHACIQWESSKETMTFFINGEPEKWERLKNRSSLLGGGNLSLGCSQTPGMNSFGYVGLIGELYMFRMWSTAQESLSKDCSEGETIKWDTDYWNYSKSAFQIDASLHCAKSKPSIVPTPSLTVALANAAVSNPLPVNTKAKDGILDRFDRDLLNRDRMTPSHAASIVTVITIPYSAPDMTTPQTVETTAGPDNAVSNNSSATTGNNTVTNNSSATTGNIIITNNSSATTGHNTVTLSSATTGHNTASNNSSATTGYNTASNNSSATTGHNTASDNSSATTGNNTVTHSSATTGHNTASNNSSATTGHNTASYNSSATTGNNTVTDNSATTGNNTVTHSSATTAMLPTTDMNITNASTAYATSGNMTMIPTTNMNVTDASTAYTTFGNMSIFNCTINFTDNVIVLSDVCDLSATCNDSLFYNINVDFQNGQANTTANEKCIQDIFDNPNNTQPNFNDSISSSPGLLYQALSSVSCAQQTLRTVNCNGIVKIHISTNVCDYLAQIRQKCNSKSNFQIRQVNYCCCVVGHACPALLDGLDTLCYTNQTVLTCGSGGSPSPEYPYSGPTTKAASVSVIRTSPSISTTPTEDNSGSYDDINALLNSTNLNASTVDKIVSFMEGVLAKNVDPKVAGLLVGVVSNFLNVAPVLLTPVSKRIITIVDTIGFKLNFSTESVNFTSPSLALAVTKINASFFTETSFAIENSAGLQVNLDTQAPINSAGSITLPSSLLDNLAAGNRDIASRIQFNYFQKASLFQDPSLLNQSASLISSVISAAVSNLTISNLVTDITVKLKTNIPPDQENCTLQCVFWDFSRNNGSGGWSSEGCWVADARGNETVCKCNHLTSFGVLLDLSRNSTIPPLQVLILTFITYIGCGLSAIFLSITLVTYIAFEKIRRDYPSQILIQLCAALLGLNLTFLLDSWIALYNNVPGLCISVAVFLHYFLLVTFTWMGLEAFHMYLALVKVFNTYVRKYILKFCIVGWGLPAIVVAIVVAISRENYGIGSYGKYPNGSSDQFCWINNDIVFYIAVVGYFCLIFLLNVSMFIVVLIQLCRIKRKKQLGNQRKASFQDLRSVAGLTFLLGITWGFAFFAWGPVNLVFMYLFAILNTLQGFFIFIFYCVAKENVRKQWRRYLCCGRFRLAENSDWSRTATNFLKKQPINQGVSSSSNNSMQSTSNGNSTNSATLLVNNEYSVHPNGNGNLSKERNGVSFNLKNIDVSLQDFSENQPVQGEKHDIGNGKTHATLRRTSNRGSIHFIDQ